MKKNKLQAFTILLTLLFLISCQANNKVKKTLPDETESKSAKSIKGETISTSENIDTANIYLENSGSMYGYVSGNGNFSSVVSTIAADCDLNFSNVNYNLVNGQTTNLGTNLATFLEPVSSVNSMNVGDPSTSDLNLIFEQILKNAGNGNISILISDGIYSVKGTGLIQKLRTASTLTRNKFVNRLREDGSLTTLLVKYESRFKGKYYPASGGQIGIDQNRPYYVWVIGESELIKHKFKEGYFQKQPGFVDIVKFAELNNSDVKCRYVSHNQIGFTRVGENKLSLDDVDVNNRNEFTFSLAFDFSKVPYNDEYFNNTAVYSNDLGYSVTEVSSSNNLDATSQIGLDINKYKHIVTFSKTGAPWGAMKVSVKNIVPKWIQDTNIDDDSSIKENTSQTFGFKHLIDGISDGYNFVNNTEDVANFNIKINRD
ncbi:MAG: hypothetical protein ACJA2M_000169 [Polaribacter sp.]|jgi:hypothetical protein